MATLNELYNELLLDVTSSASDDNVLDERLLKHFIHKTRALFARNEMNKAHRTIDATLIQSLGLVELEPTDSFVDSPLTNIEYTVLRTKLTIPRPIELHNSLAFTYIGPVDQLNKGFKLVDITAIPYAGNGRFGKNFMYAVYMNDYIYIVGNCNNPAFKGLKYINVRGVFENPEDASKFNRPDGTPCYSDDEQYPLPAYMAVYIKKEILSTDLRRYYAPIEDPQNNANNDINRLSNAEVKD